MHVIIRSTFLASIMIGYTSLLISCNQSIESKTEKELLHQVIKLSPYALSPLTLCEALRKTTEVVGTTSDDIGPANTQQQGFLDKQYLTYIKRGLHSSFTSDELQSYASRDYKELNEILKNKGFSLQFPQFPRTQIGVLAIQDVLVKWLCEGTKEPLSVGDKVYDGVVLKPDIVREGEMAGQQNLHFFMRNKSKKSDMKHNNTVIVKLLTKSGDIVYFVSNRDGLLFAQKPTQATIAQAIMDYSKELQQGIYTSADDHFNGVHFPMISYDIQPDVSWLERMRVGTATIAQAMQQVIFKMNEQGARAKAAAGLIVATAFPGALVKERLIIDTPFLVWIERLGVVLPIFVGYMTYDFWNNPGLL